MADLLLVRDKPREVLQHYSAYCDAVWKFYKAHAPDPLLEKAAFLRALDLAHAVYFSAGCPASTFIPACVGVARTRISISADRHVRSTAGLPPSQAGTPSVLHLCSTGLMPHGISGSSRLRADFAAAVRLDDGTTAGCRVAIRVRCAQTPRPHRECAEPADFRGGAGEHQLMVLAGVADFRSATANLRLPGPNFEPARVAVHAFHSTFSSLRSCHWFWLSTAWSGGTGAQLDDRLAGAGSLVYYAWWKPEFLLLLLTSYWSMRLGQGTLRRRLSRRRRQRNGSRNRL